MYKLLHFVFAGLGLPVAAQLIQHQTQKISDKVSIFTFVTRRRKDLIRTTIIALFAIVFSGSGLVLTALTYALQTDYRFEGAISSSLIVALATLMVGLLLGVYVWSHAKKIEDDLADYLQTKHESRSLLSTIFHTLVNVYNHSNDFQKNPSQKSYYAANIARDDEEHRKTLN